MFRECCAYRDGRFELYEDVNVGVAVAAQDALVVPTIFGADRKSLGAIARDARELIAKVREGQITLPELGGTFTVSNLGMYGIERFTAIINPLNLQSSRSVRSPASRRSTIAVGSSRATN